MKIYLLLLLCLLFVGSLAACNASRATFERECRKGIGEACNKFAKELETKNREGAELFFQRACDLQNTNGCVNYARLVFSRRPEAARGALKYACDRGNTQGCVRLAELLQSHQVPTR